MRKTVKEWPHKQDCEDSWCFNFRALVLVWPGSCTRNQEVVSGQADSRPMGLNNFHTAHSWRADRNLTHRKTNIRPSYMSCVQVAATNHGDLRSTVWQLTWYLLELNFPGPWRRALAGKLLQKIEVDQQMAGQIIKSSSQSSISRQLLCQLPTAVKAWADIRLSGRLLLISPCFSYSCGILDSALRS